MPSKSTILKKIREIENELNKLKVMYFEHYNSPLKDLDSTGDRHKNWDGIAHPSPDKFAESTKKVINDILNNLANNLCWDEATLKMCCKVRDLHLDKLKQENKSKEEETMNALRKCSLENQELKEKIEELENIRDLINKKQENKSKEELCECGHLVDYHSDMGCWDKDGDIMCKCMKFISQDNNALDIIKKANKGDTILWNEKEGVVKNLSKDNSIKQLLDKDYKNSAVLE